MCRRSAATTGGSSMQVFATVLADVNANVQESITGISVAIGALVAVTTRRREFLDVALGVAVFSFVGTCALAAFLERKGRRDP